MLEAVAFQSGRSQRRSDAVLTDLQRMNAVIQHDMRHRGGYIAVALEFDNYQIFERLAFARNDILPY